MSKRFGLALLGSLLLSGSVLAATGAVELDGGSAKYRELVNINMDKLASDTSYYLECRIVSDRFSGKGHSEIHVYSHGDLHVNVNGVDTATTDGAAELKFPLNSLIASGVKNTSVIKVRNLDRYDTITVQSCVATPISG